MAAAILRTKIARRAIQGVCVSSAGILPGGAAATESACATIAGLAGHVSRQVTAHDVTTADLVLCLARLHLREVAVLAPAAFPHTFTLKEFVRRGAVVGSVPLNAPLGSWLAAVGARRDVRDLLGDSSDDDVADPIGGSLAVYRHTADELDALTDRLVSLVWTYPRS